MPAISLARGTLVPLVGTAGSATITDHVTNAPGLVQNIRTPAVALRIHINITAFSGTSITYTIKEYDPLAITATRDLLPSAAKSATGYFTLEIGPGITDAAITGSAKLSAYAPRVWKLVTTGTITSVTHSILYETVGY